MYFAGISDEAGQEIERQISAHRELGWKHLELRGVSGANLTYVDDAVFDHVVEAVGAAGMQVCCFASQLANWGRPVSKDFAVDVDELSRAIPRMHRLGTRMIRCMSWPNDGLSEAEWSAEAVRRMKELARQAEDGGVTLVHENCNGWGGESPENTLELLERVDSPALKLVFDTGNPFMHAQNALEFLRQVVDHVIHVHIKDGYREGDQNVFTYPDEGSCRVGACLRLLIEHGYDGGYSIEPHVAGIIHASGLMEGADLDEVKYESYKEYGRRLMAVYERAAQAAATQR